MGKTERSMAFAWGLTVLCASVCVLHGADAIPATGGDVVELLSVEPSAQQEVIAAEKAVKDISLGKSPNKPSKTAALIPGVSDIYKDRDRKYPRPVRRSAYGETPLNINHGVLKPGDRGFLEEQMKGPPKTYEEAVDRIDRALKEKRVKKRMIAYKHEHVARLARAAGNAVADMAQEVQKEAAEHAERLAADAAECAQELASTADPDKKKLLVKACKEKVAAKKQAYQEAAQAGTAADKAVATAGANEGRIRGEAALYADGTTKYLNAVNAATAAKLKLETFEQQMKIDDQIRQRRFRHKEATEAQMEAYQKKIQEAQDRFDEEDAADEARDRRPFPVPAKQRQPPAATTAEMGVIKQAEQSVQDAIKKARANPTPANARAANDLAKKLAAPKED